MRIALALLLAACTHPRETPWREDLRVLAAELPRRHVDAFFRVTGEAWRARVAELDGAIAGMDEAHAEVGLARLVAAIGDGHTRIGVFGRTGVYPIVLVWFDDGIFVVGADAEHGWAIGKKLVGIGTHPVDEVIAAMSPVVARDNVAGLHGELPTLLEDPALLAGVDLAATDHATFRLAGADGTTRELELRPGPHEPAPITDRPIKA